MREAHSDLLADGSLRQLQVAVGKFAFTVGRHFTAAAVVEAHDGLILSARPQQRIFVDPVGFGQRDAKSGAEGVGAGVIDRAVAGDHRYRTIGEVAKRHPQVAIDQLIGAVTNDDVDTTALFVERDHPVRAIFIAAARRGADVIPVGHRRAQRVAGFIVPEIEVFAAVVRRATAGDPGNIHQVDDRLVFYRRDRFAGHRNVR